MTNYISLESLWATNFKKWMFWSLISKCNLTSGIPNDCKLCVRHAYLRKDYSLYVEENNGILRGTRAQAGEKKPGASLPGSPRLVCSLQSRRSGFDSFAHSINSPADWVDWAKRDCWQSRDIFTSLSVLAESKYKRRVRYKAILYT